MYNMTYFTFAIVVDYEQSLFRLVRLKDVNIRNCDFWASIF